MRVETALRTAWVARGAAALVVLTRLPFAVTRLWDHDSVQFALGVLDFDLAAHQPHPPGYPLYVGLLKVMAALGVEPGTGMVAVSILAEAAGAWAFVHLAARWGGDGAPPLAAALYVFNPLLWFYGELPLVYAVEGGLTAVLALAAARMGDGPRPFLVACVLFALAGGVRPSTLVLLFPLFLYGLWRAWRDGGYLTPARVAAGAALGAVCVLAWLLPLLAAAGGLAAYRRISGEHFAALLPVTSVLHGAGVDALVHNLTVLTKWSLQGLVPAAAAVAVAWLLRPGRVVPGLRNTLTRAGWLAAWALPPLLFFALFHVTKAGYTLVCLAPLVMAGVLVAAPPRSLYEAPPRSPEEAAERPSRRTWLATLAPALAALLTGAALFLLGADRAPDQPRWLAVVRHEFNRTALATYDSDLDALLAVLDHYPPERTLLATVELSGTGGAGADGFLYPYHRHLQWYAPDHEVTLLVPEQEFALWTPGERRSFRRLDGTVPVPAGTDRILFVLAALPGDRLPLPPGEVVLASPTFTVLAVPFRGDMTVGPLRLVPAAPEAGSRRMVS